MIDVYLEERGEEVIHGANSLNDAIRYFDTHYGELSQRRSSYARGKYHKLRNEILEATNVVELEIACARAAECLQAQPPQFSYKTIVVSVDTTGCDRQKDEILQISIISGEREVIFDEFIKPSHTETWEEAEKLNHISPQMVADARPIDDYVDRLNEIFSNTDLILGYNPEHFDFRFLYNAGVRKFDSSKILNVMIEYSEWKKELNEHGSYKWFKLKDVVRNLFGCEMIESSTRIPFKNVMTVLDIHEELKEKMLENVGC